MGSFGELERRIRATQAPTSTTPAYDLCGFLPDQDKPVTIEIEGLKPITFGPPLVEPVAGLIMNVQLMRGDADISVVQNLGDVTSLFTVVEWDPKRRYLKVRRNEDVYASKVTTRTDRGVTTAVIG